MEPFYHKNAIFTNKSVYLMAGRISSTATLPG